MTNQDLYVKSWELAVQMMSAITIPKDRDQFEILQNWQAYFLKQLTKEEKPND